jgi:Ser/Thr protein kinase RdoA (MazF antagonist)
LANPEPDEMPTEVRALLGEAASRVRRLPGRSPVWRCTGAGPGDPVVVRRHLSRVRGHDMVTDLVWAHDFLDQLAATGFPAPRPRRLLGGRSCVRVDGHVWEALSFVPGRVIGWGRRPSMSSVGAFLARYHDAIGGIRMPTPRPTALPLDQLVTVDRRRAETVLGRRAGQFLGRQIDTLAESLAAIDHRRAPCGVIHADFTNHNVLTDRERSAPRGVIDFANAYEEALLADIAFGLWRSARPRQAARRLVMARITDLVAGYHRVRPLPGRAARAIVVYLAARGVQMLAKRTLEGIPDVTAIDEIQWITGNQAQMHHAIAQVVAAD